MEIHFINWDTEPDVKVWENSNDSKIENAWKYILWEKLYNMLDGNESDYLTYLTARVKKLWWWKFDELTVKDDLLEVKPNYNLQNSERLPEQTVGTVNYWIWILRQFIENTRRLFPPVVRSMNDIMKEMFARDGMPQEIAEMMIAEKLQKKKIWKQLLINLLISWPVSGERIEA